MTVIIGVRDPQACQEVVERSIGSLLSKEKVVYERCDVADMDSVREFASKVQKKFPAINLLINNGELIDGPSTRP